MVPLCVEVATISDVKLFLILNIDMKVVVTILMFLLTNDALLNRGFRLEECFHILFRDWTLRVSQVVVSSFILEGVVTSIFFNIHYKSGPVGPISRCNVREERKIGPYIKIKTSFSDKILLKN